MGRVLGIPTNPQGMFERIEGYQVIYPSDPLPLGYNKWTRQQDSVRDARRQEGAPAASQAIQGPDLNWNRVWGHRISA